MLYESLADNFAHLIETGVYQLGTRLPSVRRISVEKDLSVSTCVRAYHELERRGVIEARPRSGFFVLSAGTGPALPSVSSEAETPVPVSGRDRILRMLDAAAEPDMTNFGAASPHPEFMPSGAIAKASSRIWHTARRRCMTQAFPPARSNCEQKSRDGSAWHLAKSRQMIWLSQMTAKHRSRSPWDWCVRPGMSWPLNHRPITGC